VNELPVDNFIPGSDADTKAAADTAADLNIRLFGRLEHLECEAYLAGATLSGSNDQAIAVE
jgi:hypothetical protein